MMGVELADPKVADWAGRMAAMMVDQMDILLAGCLVDWKVLMWEPPWAAC